MGTNVGNVNPYTQQSPGEYCVGCEQIDMEMPNYMFGQAIRDDDDGFAVNSVLFRSGSEFDHLYDLAYESVREIGRWYRTTTRTQPGTATSTTIYDADGSVISSGNPEPDQAPTVSVSTQLLRIVYSSSWHFSPNVVRRRQKDAKLEKAPITEPLWSLRELLLGAQLVIAQASGECEKLLGKDALSKFEKSVGNITYDASKFSTSLTNGTRIGESIYLNPNGYAFSNVTYYGRDAEKLNKAIQKELSSATTRFEYALATVIHEFLHLIGTFGPDGGGDNEESRKNQKRVLEACFPKPKK